MTGALRTAVNQKLKELEREGPMFLVANREGGASVLPALMDGSSLAEATSEQKAHCHFNLIPSNTMMQVELNSNCADAEGHWEVQGSAWSPRVTSSLLRLCQQDTQRRASQDRAPGHCSVYSHTGSWSGLWEREQEGLTEGG